MSVAPDPARPDRPTDQRILQATIQGLAALDPAALAIQKICGLAEVTPPTIYYQFGSKDGMIAAAVEQLVEQWLAVIDASVSRTGSFQMTVTAAILAWEATITSPTRPIAVFSWVTLLASATSPKCREALIRARQRARAMLAEGLADRVDPADADDLAGVVLDTVLASSIHYELDGDRALLRERLEALGRTVQRSTPPSPGE